MIPLIPSVLAIGLPLVALWKLSKGNLKAPFLYPLGSFALCGWAFLSELFTIKSRLLANDVSGLLDTIDAVLMLCSSLLFFTILLNLVLLMCAFNNRSKDTNS